MNKSKFDSEQEAIDYKREHNLVARVVEPLSGGKWGLVFPLKAHITVNDGAPEGMRGDVVMKAAVGSFFVASTGVYQRVIDATQWKPVAAKTLDGAKRAAIKNASGATFTAHVGQRDASGAIKLVAVMDDSKAITRSRAVWRDYPIKATATA